MSVPSPATILLLAGVVALAQTDPRGLAGTDTKPEPDDYPVHASAGKVSLGAEYMVRSVQRYNRTFFARGYLVIEVALYPSKGEALTVSSKHFTVRVNGKKRVLFPESAGFVVASMKYPDWERRPTVLAGGGLGNTGVIIGGPPVTERFPGDPRPPQTRLPRQPRAPEMEDRSGLEREASVSAEEVVVHGALPEGEISEPASGYLYFAYKKKTKSIRTLDLIYQGPAGTATLRLF
jgi:hypothetical protein